MMYWKMLLKDLVPILGAGNHKPSYDDIDRWLEEAQNGTGTLPQ